MIARNFDWAIGLFEGEGSCSIKRTPYKDRVYCSPQLALGMTDEDVVRQFHAVVRVGHVGGPYQEKKRTPTGATCKPYWTWHCNKTRDVLKLARRMLPKLGQRRAAKVRVVCGL
jgi:hypothetical protein